MSENRPALIVEQGSTLGFSETVERLTDAIMGAGMTIFAKIDHAANAREAGMTMPPATVLIYGNPEGGTPVMLSAPFAALDLPLRVLVRQREDGTAAIVFRPVSMMLEQLCAPPDVAARLEPAQRMLLAAIVS